MSGNKKTAVDEIQDLLESFGIGRDTLYTGDATPPLIRHRPEDSEVVRKINNYIAELYKPIEPCTPRFPWSELTLDAIARLPINDDLKDWLSSDNFRTQFEARVAKECKSCEKPSLDILEEYPVLNSLLPNVVEYTRKVRGWPPFRGGKQWCVCGLDEATCRALESINIMIQVPREDPAEMNLSYTIAGMKMIIEGREFLHDKRSCEGDCKQTRERICTCDMGEIPARLLLHFINDTHPKVGVVQQRKKEQVRNDVEAAMKAKEKLEREAAYPHCEVCLGNGKLNTLKMCVCHPAFSFLPLGPLQPGADAA